MLWRRLKRLGVAQLLDGLVALPLDSRNREQLEWLADEVIESGGEASIWLAEPATAAQQRALAARMANLVRADYLKVADEALVESAGDDLQRRRRALARLRRELHRIGRRDHFPPPEREGARRAVDELAATLEPVSA